MSKTKEPSNTGDRTKFKFAFEITPRRVIAPLRGCKQRNNYPRAIAIATAISEEKDFLPKQLKEKAAGIPLNKLPIIKFRR